MRQKCFNQSNLKAVFVCEVLYVRKISSNFVKGQGQCHPKHVKHLLGHNLKQMYQPDLLCITFHHVKHLIGQIVQITKLLFPWQLLFICILQV